MPLIAISNLETSPNAWICGLEHLFHLDMWVRFQVFLSRWDHYLQLLCLFCMSLSYDAWAKWYNSWRGISVRRNGNNKLPAKTFCETHFVTLQTWSKRWRLGCVYSPPRPERARKRESRNLASAFYFMSVQWKFIRIMQCPTNITWPQLCNL